MTNLTATDECGFDTDECGSAIDECGPAIDECGSESGSDTSSAIDESRSVTDDSGSTADKSGSATVSTAESSHSCNSQTSTILVQLSGTAVTALAILRVQNDNPLRAVAERCAFIRVIVTRSSLERSQYSSLSFPPDLFSRY
jgi:hypothetical protein